MIPGLSTHLSGNISLHMASPFSNSLRYPCRWLFNAVVLRYVASSTQLYPNRFPLLLKSSDLRSGEAIHAFIKKRPKFTSDAFMGVALIQMYARCGKICNAQKVFDGYQHPDCFMWTSVLSGYHQSGLSELALKFFSKMVKAASVKLDSVTLVSAVSASAQCGEIWAGKLCHGLVIRLGFDVDLSLSNALLNFYLKLGCLSSAKNLFDGMSRRDVISWSCVIGGYCRNGKAVEALELFSEMVERGFEPNSVTLVSSLQACATASDVNQGRKMHELAITKGFEMHLAVSTALVDMYMKCGCVKEAVGLFNRMPRKDVVSWAALISGFAQNGFANESLEVFRRMLSDRVAPDAVTMVKILVACSQLGVVKQALCLHGYLTSSGFESKMFVGAALIDLYSKCGSLGNAVHVFERMEEKDVVVWSSMISGYGIHGHGNEAIRIFNQMVESSLIPNHVTFVSILSACSHAGLVDEGIDFFNKMVNSFCLVPYSEHFCIMVDLLGRKGQLERAFELVEQMPDPANPHVWGALLGACRIHGNTKFGEHASKKLFELDPSHGGYYVLLSNIYANNGRWDGVAEIRSLMKEKGVTRISGRSSIEVGNKISTFMADDRSHPKFKRILKLLRELEVEMKEGHTPKTMLILDN